MLRRALAALAFSFVLLTPCAEAALSAKVGSFNTGTGIIGSTVAVTGVGFQPKVVFFWMSGRTETVDTVGAQNLYRTFGAAVSATDRRVVTMAANSGDASSNTSNYHSDAACLVRALPGETGGILDHQSMDADGFTLVVDEVWFQSQRIHYLALGGADLTNVATFQFQEPAAAGNQDITSLSFQPDAVIFFSAGNSTAPPNRDDTTDSTTMVGFAAGSTPANAVWLGAADDGVATMETKSYSRSGESIALFDAAISATNARASVTAWLSNGFSLNWAERADTRYIHGVALKGGQYIVGDLLTQTDTTTDIAESGFGFSPVAAMFVSHNKAASAADTPQDHDEWSLGAFSSTTSRGAMATLDEDASPNTECARAVEHDEVYANISTADAIEGLMDIKSVDADGFTCIMDDADPAQSYAGYLAFGSAAAATCASFVSLLGVGCK